MFAFDRRRWDDTPAKRRAKAGNQASSLFAHLQQRSEGDVALCALVAHECDLMLVHYARRYDDLVYLRMLVDKLALREFLTPRASYTSVLELGLYDATAKMHKELEGRGLRVNTPEWVSGFEELMRAQAESPHVAPRLFARLPQRRYACFYPMNKRRGERDNWYALPYADRAAMMNEHGKVGRSYHGKVTQVISGSIGYDDYEWGVDLYSDDPLVFKRLVYEMRFDEASARYAEFGPFYSGVQFSSAQLPIFLEGDGVPQLDSSE